MEQEVLSGDKGLTDILQLIKEHTKMPNGGRKEGSSIFPRGQNHTEGEWTSLLTYAEVAMSQKP